MSIQDEPHYEIPAEELAIWLERQGDSWWFVDGDPILAVRVSMPCPGEEIAVILRRLKRPLLVLDTSIHPQGKGEVIDNTQLDRLMVRWGDGMTWPPGQRPLSADNRFLYFSWKGSDDEWMLREDLETTESERADAAELNKDA